MANLQEDEPDSDRSSPPAGGSPAEDLLPMVYEELHTLAEQWMAGESPGHTLQPTALVHEAYLRLAGRPGVRWQGRTHFCAIAAGAMRRVLIDHARRRGAAKRGAGWQRVSLAEAAEQEAPECDVPALVAALEKLATLNERHCRVVELRFLAGLSVDETAEALGIAPRTAKQDWRMARAWLHRELEVES